MSNPRGIQVFGQGAGDKTQRIVWIAGLVVTLGMLVVSGMLTFDGVPGRPPSIGVGLTSFLVFTASTTGGAFLGFLFGLPRARVVDSVAAPQAGGPEQANWRASHFLANSNLIKVSDWLTTIIIGLTLVNLGEVVPAATRLADALSAPLGGQAHSATVGLAVVIGSTLTGFLLAFLWTSIRVRELLEEAERHATQVRVPDLTNRTVDEAKAAAERLGVQLAVRRGTAGSETVAEQEPKPGTWVTSKDRVRLTTR